MGRSPCCSKEGLNRGAWTAQEDTILSDFVKAHGEGRWRSLPKRAGLKRCGKSCRLRWLNYLRPDIKRGNISPDEEELIIRLHKLLGNRWSLIAGRLPGRTDNEIKNYWNTNLGKRHQQNHDNQRTKTATYGTISPSPSHSKPMNDAKLPPVVWTKALKCSKQVFPRNDRPDQLKPDQTPTKTRDHDPMMPNQAGHGNTLSTTLTSNSFESNFMADHDHSVLDFNIGDLCLTDLLDCTDFTTLSDSHQPAAEIMLSGEHGIGLDMHHFASFVDYNGEDQCQWLG